MKIVLISVLLFFEICSGLSVHKVQHKRSTETDVGAADQLDIYEVDEGDSNTVKLTHPKPEKPTLREIIYYHLIEYPYEDQGKAKVIQPTEGDGLDVNRDDPPNDPEDEVPQGNEDEESNGQDSFGGQDAVEEVTTADAEQAKRFKLDVRTRNGEAASDKVKEDYQNNVVPSDKKKNARNVLFDQARIKYVKRQEKPSIKRKREISSKNMPPAPTLPPLNLGALPEYIRRLITSESEPKTTLKDKLTHFDDEDFSEELEKKIDDMISSLKPQDDEGEDDDDDDDDDDDSETDEDEDDTEYDSENDVEDENTNVKQIPRTFGMNLTMGRGYVWNDLLSKPGMPGISFDIGQSEDSSENTREETTQEPETTKKADEHTLPEKPEEEKHSNTNNSSHPIEPFTNVPLPTESTPIHIGGTNSEGATNIDSSNDKNPDNDEHKDKDLEDIDINNFKPKLLDADNPDEKESEHQIGKDNKESEPTTADVVKNRDYDTELHTIEPNKKTHSNHHKKDKHKHKPNNKHNKDDSLKEIMKNEEFWKWLSEWTSSYMDLLMEHIKRLVHDEVTRQIKDLALDLKKDTPPEAHDEKTVTKDEKDDNDSKSSSDYTKNDTNAFINNYQLIAEKDESSTSDTNTLTQDDTSLVNDGNAHRKMIPDGDDDLLLINFTHTTNFDLNKDYNQIYNNEKFNEKESNDLADFLRHKKHETDNEHKKKPNAENSSSKGKKNKSPIRISATNIFGNAAGSEKVTNIFIFYPSNNSDHENGILSNITPSSTGVNNIFVFGKEDKTIPEISKQKDESDVTDKDSKNSTEQLNDDLTKSNNTIENKKDLKEGKVNVESETEPPTASLEENIKKVQNASEKIEQITTDQPKHALNKDDKIETTTLNYSNTETTTLTSLLNKEQENVKFYSENKDNISESITNTENSVTDKMLDDKENENTDLSNKLTEKQLEKLEEKVEKELEDRILKTLEAKIEREVQAKIEKELLDKKNQHDDTEHEQNQNTEKLVEEQLKSLEEKMERALEEKILKDIEAKIDKEVQRKFEKELSDKKNLETKEHNDTEHNNIAHKENQNTDKLVEEELKGPEDKIKKALEEKISKDLEAMIDKEDQKNFEKELSDKMNQHNDTEHNDIEHKENQNTEKLVEEQVKELEEKIEKALEEKISKDLEAQIDKEVQKKFDKELSDKNQLNDTEHKETQNTEEQVKALEEKVETELNDKTSKELEAKFEKELQNKIEQELAKATEKQLNEANNKENENDLKKDDSEKEGTEKESENDSEKIKESGTSR